MNLPLEAPVQRWMACLAVPSRFRLMRVLGEGERCVTDLAAEIGLSQSCTTRHLQMLEAAGLVQGTRAGKRVLFRARLDEAHVRALLGWALAAGSQAGTSPPGDGMPRRKDSLEGADLHRETPAGDGAGRPAREIGPRSRARHAPAPRPGRGPATSPERPIASLPAVSLAGQAGSLADQAVSFADLAGSEGDLSGSGSDLAGSEGDLTGSGSDLAGSEGDLAAADADAADRPQLRPGDLEDYLL